MRFHASLEEYRPQTQNSHIPIDLYVPYSYVIPKLVWDRAGSALGYGSVESCVSFRRVCKLQPLSPRLHVGTIYNVWSPR